MGALYKAWGEGALAHGLAIRSYIGARAVRLFLTNASHNNMPPGLSWTNFVTDINPGMLAMHVFIKGSSLGIPGEYVNISF